MNDEDALPSTPAALAEPDDRTLLQRYVESGAQEAFAEIVRRRIGLVYSVALRQTHGDRHRAEDVCQSVFCDLARKARSLLDRPVLGGWLYRSAQFAAAGAVRAEQRRQNREREAHRMQQISGNDETDWGKLRPLLDVALSEIEERDRDAVILRFFDGHSFGSIGARLQLSENAARMRVERALDKLAATLARHGVTSTATAVGAALAHQIGTAAPAGLAASVTGTALAQAGLTAVGGAGILLGMTKVQLATVAAVTMGGIAAIVGQQNTNAALRRELAALAPERAQLAALQQENAGLTAQAAEVVRLRRDDVEFQELGRQITELQENNARRTRLAEARAAQGKYVQSEIDRLNREGNALVEQYKALSAQAKDTSASAERRSSAEAAAKLKLAEIQAKQREVQAYIAASRAAHPDLPMWSASPGASRYALADSAERTAKRAAADQANGTTVGSRENERVSFTLPQADIPTLLSALEKTIDARILRDPSIAGAPGRVDITSDRQTRREAAETLRNALHRLNVVLEPTSDGAVVAKRGPSP